MRFAEALSLCVNAMPEPLKSEPYKTTRRVEFRDTDAAGIVHFSVYFHYMEQVEHELWRSLGLSILEHDEQGSISWPRVAASCDYVSAIHFEDVLDVQIRVTRLGRSSVTYEVEFTQAGRRVGTGSMTSVCCRLRGTSPIKAIPIPAAVRDKLATVLSTSERREN